MLPQEVYKEKVLLPQFNFELDNLLDNYIKIEKVLLKHYYELDLIKKREVEDLLTSIKAIKKSDLKLSSNYSMTDISFTLEQEIEKNLSSSIPNWHLDRSRNDFQACSQLMYAREKYICIINEVQQFFRLIINIAADNIYTIFPGFTHNQAAQIISVGFYLTAISHHLLETLNKMKDCLEHLNSSCPLGSGSLAGQEYSWDVEQMARDLGFNSYTGHAMVSVSSRNWVLEIGDSLVFLTNNLSRILTDFMNWGGSEYQYIDLPDDLTGISSSMPQKRNFPILERIRGKTSHILSYYFDFLLGQRNTPFTNTVEVSKESSSNLNNMFNTTNDIIGLLTLFMSNVKFDEDLIREKCKKDYYGGFTLANELTIQNKIPYRLSQVIVGKFISESIQSECDLQDLSSKLLDSICSEYGFENKVNEEKLKKFFNVDYLLIKKISKGSTHPESVKKIIKCQWERYAKFSEEFTSIFEEINRSYKNIEEWTPLKERKI